MKPKIIRLSPYPFDLLVFSCWKKKDIIKWIKEEIPEQVLQSPELFRFDWKWRTIRTEWWWIILWIKEKDVSILAHEVFHAVEFLYDKVWISHSIENWEAWAYMIQFIMYEILKDEM